MKLPKITGQLISSATGQGASRRQQNLVELLGDDPYADASLVRFLQRDDRAAVDRLIDVLAGISGGGSGGAAVQARMLARRLTSMIADRRLAVEATLRLASTDLEFVEFIRAGDLARDAGNWERGEYNYWKALQIYPLHRGYKVQYAHCLKEQGKYYDAELRYREALALGERSGDLIRHLRFIAEMSGHSVSGATLDSIAAYWEGGEPYVPLGVPAIGSDIAACGDLLLGRSAWSASEACHLMDQCPRLHQVVRAMMKRPEFVQANRELLTLIAETEGALA